MQKQTVKTDEFVRAGGRLVHLPRTKGRILTIAYWRDRLEDTIYFAGSMFTPDDSQPDFAAVRKGNNLTAVNRCVTWGHRMTDPIPFDPTSTMTIKEENKIVEEFLSRTIFTTGSMRCRRSTLPWEDFLALMTLTQRKQRQMYPAYFVERGKRDDTRTL